MFNYIFLILKLRRLLLPVLLPALLLTSLTSVYAAPTSEPNPPSSQILDEPQGGLLNAATDQ